MKRSQFSCSFRLLLVANIAPSKARSPKRSVLAPFVAMPFASQQVEPFGLPIAFAFAGR